MDLLAFPFSVHSENGKAERVKIENEIKLSIDENKLNLASLENIKKMSVFNIKKDSNTKLIWMSFLQTKKELVPSMLFTLSGE